MKRCILLPHYFLCLSILDCTCSDIGLFLGIIFNLNLCLIAVFVLYIDHDITILFNGLHDIIGIAFYG